MHGFYDGYDNKYLGFFWSIMLVAFFLTLANTFFIKSNFITIGIAIVIAAIYSIYLIIDTQLIFGGRNVELTLDNYVLGAVLLYIDIVQLFLELLKIIGTKK
jgi:FtsH-binding integral membrane protein